MWSMPMSFTIWSLMAAIFFALLKLALLVLLIMRMVVTLVTSFTSRHILIRLPPGSGLKWQVLQVRHWLTTGFPGSQSLCRRHLTNVSSLSLCCTRIFEKCFHHLLLLQWSHSGLLPLKSATSGFHLSEPLFKQLPGLVGRGEATSRGWIPRRGQKTLQPAFLKSVAITNLIPNPKWETIDMIELGFMETEWWPPQ